MFSDASLTVFFYRNEQNGDPICWVRRFFHFSTLTVKNPTLNIYTAISLFAKQLDFIPKIGNKTILFCRNIELNPKKY